MTRRFEVGVVVGGLELMERFCREVLGRIEVHRSRVPASSASRPDWAVSRR
ncbi:hypothetical protein OOK27_09245 [Streptomyces canus]|uniref:hypothetical protein n=1 Tax=Streptomyces canus TaxID=58343 RepID=UPI00225A1139|nr:hypothetical protein [Streptomyces canus]MCX5254362.1 hypothetical protein [Streptomyces canus]